MYGILTRSGPQQEPQELREYSSFTMGDINTHTIRWEEQMFSFNPRKVSDEPVWEVR